MERAKRVKPRIHTHAFNSELLKFILPLRVKQLVRPVVILLRHQHIGQTIQIAVVGLTWVNECLGGMNAVLFEHHHERFRVDDGAGVEKFHGEILKAAE